MVYPIGKPRRLPIPRHPCRPGSLLRRNSAGAPSTKLLGVHFLKPSPMNPADAQRQSCSPKTKREGSR